MRCVVIYLSLGCGIVDNVDGFCCGYSLVGLFFLGIVCCGLLDGLGFF